jgi:hypothetical protein
MSKILKDSLYKDNKDPPLANKDKLDLDSPPKYTYSTRLTNRYTRFKSLLALGPSRYIHFRFIDFYITPNIPLIK